MNAIHRNLTALILTALIVVPRRLTLAARMSSTARSNRQRLNAPRRRPPAAGNAMRRPEANPALGGPAL